MIHTLNHFIPQGIYSFTLEKLGGVQAYPCKRFRFNLREQSASANIWFLCLYS